MRQSLMMGARPRFSANHEFPRVPLGKGLWRIETENRVDTKLAVTVFTSTDHPDGSKSVSPGVKQLPDNGEVLTVLGPVHVQMQILEGGSEQYINVVAVRHD